MSGSGNASGRWLQSANAAEVSGHTNRAAAIAAHAARGHARGNRCRFTAARSAWRAVQIPRIVGAAMKQVVGFPRHQKFWRIGHCRARSRRRPANAPPAAHPAQRTNPARSRVPDSQRRPATLIELLMLMGTPCRGPRVLLCVTAASAIVCGLPRPLCIHLHKCVQSSDSVSRSGSDALPRVRPGRFSFSEFARPSRTAERKVRSLMKFPRMARSSIRFSSAVRDAVFALCEIAQLQRPNRPRAPTAKLRRPWLPSCAGSGGSCPHRERFRASSFSVRRASGAPVSPAALRRLSLSLREPAIRTNYHRPAFQLARGRSYPDAFPAR